MRHRQLVSSILIISFLGSSCFLPPPDRPWEKKTVARRSSLVARGSKKPVARKPQTASSKQRDTRYEIRDTTPVIVIDPGHGGKDPGAIGRRKTEEKDVVMRLSEELESVLKKRLGAKVVLTRRDDKYLTLEKRNAIAQRNKADVFISLHANSVKGGKAKGIEIYYLNNATDEASRRLAMRENKGIEMSQREVEEILATLIQNESTERSLDLSKWIYQSVKKSFRGRYPKDSQIKLKSALFYVLVGAQTASVLAEVGFLSNSEEEKRLGEKSYRRKMADTLATGIENYLKKSKLAQETL